ncbi:MAG: hypothetical protein PUP93_28775 [Rhizonema sp. NSF051]|nr:hypothetical protein [Rhizonema sp. NSF051]
MASIFSQQNLDQKLTTILCERLSVRHQQNCLAAAEVVSPLRAKQFWQALKASAKMYTILVSKIRLLDTADNLVTTQYGSDKQGKQGGEEKTNCLSTLSPPASLLPLLPLPASTDKFLNRTVLSHHPKERFSFWGGDSVLVLQTSDANAVCLCWGCYYSSFHAHEPHCL